MDSLEAGLEESRKTRRPVLVDVGAEWCGWCKKLDAEIRKPEVQAALATWVLVKLDSDKDPATVRKLAVGPIPALRVLSGNGRTVAAHDGFVPADRLIKWLDEQYKPATAGSDLLSMEPKDAGEAQAMINELTGVDGKGADALVREAAIRLLVRRPDVAAGKAIEAFEKGKLTARLALFELFNEWNAPLTGIDPWDPATVTPQRLDVLKKWAAEQKDKPAPTTGPTTVPTTGPASTRPATADAAREAMSPEALAAAERDIAMMLAAEGSFEVRALRERLARAGQALLPEISARLKVAATEQDRLRLAALRYRVSASDELATAWPDGFDRLASADAEVRHAAVDELAGKASAADGALLLELFADADPFVRETSLRVLQSVGGEAATASIVKLLSDPEPNVRAAVLKQLGEHPTPNSESHVIAFVERETDQDLIVHGIRVLRESKSKASTSALMKLLSHESWRVRAEAAEGLGKLVEAKGSPSSRLAAMEGKADVYAAMIKLLDDPDGFVVSRAVLVLRDAKVPSAIEPLAMAVERRPELAPDVLRALSDNGANATSLKYLRQFCSHANPTIRAGAIKALVQSMPGGSGAELAAALRDDVPAVRLAAATAATEALATLRPNPDEEVRSGGFFGLGSKAQPKPRDMEQWLARFRTGTTRPDWVTALAEPLERMVRREAPGATPAEALTAAVPLVAIGVDAVALPVLKEAAAGDDAALRRAAGAALPWVPWEERSALFKQLTTKADRDELAVYLQSLSQMPTPLAADTLWSSLSLPAADVELGDEVFNSLRRVYLGTRYYDRSDAMKPKRDMLAAAAKAKLADGTPVQRFVALALLTEQVPAEAIEPAEKLIAELPNTDPLKVDAFTTLMLAKAQQDEKTATAAAVAALASDSPYESKKVAVKFLATGVQGLQPIRGSIYLSLSYTSSEVYEIGNEKAKPVSIPPPEGLKPEMVRGMLTDTDKPIAACAGYLLCLFKERQGLDPLLAQWRVNPNDHNTRRMVYRAIAALNDESLSPVLEEVYRTMAEESYYARDFYWTIRSIPGEGVKTLRKTIRDQVGIAELE